MLRRQMYTFPLKVDAERRHVHFSSQSQCWEEKCTLFFSKLMLRGNMYTFPLEVDAEREHIHFSSQRWCWEAMFWTPLRTGWRKTQKMPKFPRIFNDFLSKSMLRGRMCTLFLSKICWEKNAHFSSQSWCWEEKCTLFLSKLMLTWKKYTFPFKNHNEGKLYTSPLKVDAERKHVHFSSQI